MQLNTKRPIFIQALPNAVLNTFALVAVPKRLISTWNWRAGASRGSGNRFLFNWRLDARWEKRAIEELRRMSDRELADIGLSRSDLTLEGLKIAGSKRALRQDDIATEIAKSTGKTGADQHGD